MQSDVLDTIDDPSLRMYVCWVPILQDDSEAAAQESSGLVTDARAAHYWDRDRELPPRFALTLELPEGIPAWDVYLQFGRRARWDAGTPPTPSMWQHQLGEVANASTLNVRSFALAVRETLASAE